MTSEPQELEYLNACLSVIVVGASGDLAKKKTFPSLLHLFADDLLPKNFVIWGYARSNIGDDGLRDRIRPYLTKLRHSGEVVESFLQHVRYQNGASYGDLEGWTKLKTHLESFESSKSSEEKAFNRLFYFAIPPSVFAETAASIKKTCMQDEDKGFTRLIVEKPFGRDLESFEKLNLALSSQFTEDQMFRIDHYLGKEMVQNLTVIRFSNVWTERIWNADNVKMVILTFKEPFGTDGRGGYFDQ